MWLSQLHLNPRDRQVARDLADCRGMHRTLMRAFPALPAESTKHPREAFDVLYRLETSRHGVGVLVQSAEKPDWEALMTQWGNGFTLAPRTPKEIDGYHASIMTGQTLLFRLHANPTRKIDTKTRPDGTRSNGNRVLLRTEQERIEWLRRKGDIGPEGGHCGFDLLAVHTTPRVTDVRERRTRVVGGWKGEERDVWKLTLDAVLFEGRMRVTDAAQFRQALRAGIGPGKAFGFGLLSVMPIH